MRLARALPPIPFRGILLRRAAVLWLLCRLTLLMFGGFDYVHPEAPTSFALVALVAFLTLADARRRHEVVLLGNLGVGTTGLVITGTLPPVVLEVAAWLVIP